MRQLLDLKVSYQKDTWSKLSKELTIEQVLKDIQGITYKRRIELLRKTMVEQGIEAFKAEKLKLPCVTFCATFTGSRKKELIKDYNHLIVIDFDKLTQEELKAALESLEKDEHVFAFWLSPSGQGIKGLVPISYSCSLAELDLAHKSAFDKLSVHFHELHNLLLDQSGNDTTRLCFVSWDENMVIREKVKPFHIAEHNLLTKEIYDRQEARKAKIYTTSKKNALFNPAGKNRNTEKRAMKDILIYLTKRKIVVTGSYENRYKIAYAIANSFTYDIGKTFYLDLCKIEIGKYKEEKEVQLLEYCYVNNAGWTKFRFIEELLAKDYKYVKKTLERAVQ